MFLTEMGLDHCTCISGAQPSGGRFKKGFKLTDAADDAASDNADAAAADDDADGAAAAVDCASCITGCCALY